MNYVGSEVQQRKRLENGPAKKEETFAVVGVIALLPVAAGELVQPLAARGIVPFKVVSLLHQEHRHVRVWKPRLPQAACPGARSDRYGEGVGRGSERHTSCPD